MFCLVANAQQVDNGYKIESWHYEATVHSDDTWDVTETMVVNFLETRHGIYRYIPRLFRNEHPYEGQLQPFTYYVDIDGVSVDGYNYECYGSDDSQENLVIKIGDADIVLQGEHRYVISYRMRYPDDRYDGSDEVFHTILGADCSTTIGEFTYNITFEKPLPASIKYKVYSGSWGDEGNKLNVTPQYSERSISGTLLNVSPFHGVTLHGVMPQGYWEEPYGVKPDSNNLWLYGTLALMLLTLVQLFAHRRKMPLKVIEYNAPDNMSSAEVGVIIDDTADLSDLSSLIVWFASKGYLKITEIDKKGNLEIEKLRELPEDAPEYQHKFMNVLFGKGSDKVQLSKLGDRHNQISQAWFSLGRYFSGERKLITVNWRLCLMFLVSIAAGVVFFSTCNSVTEADGTMILYAFMLWAMPIAFVSFLRMYFSRYDMIISKVWRIAQFVAIIACAAVSLLILSGIYSSPDNLQPLSMLMLIAGGGWLMALLSGRLLKDTAYRCEKMSLLLGFREFIDKAEMPMLKAQVDENPSYFYDVLPYAMVFGLTKKWQKQFENIEMKAPDWYQTHSSINSLSSYETMNRMTRNMSRNMQRPIEISSHDTTVQHSHSSSSSSFGGFSGGGGGGGGVGSW